MRTALLLLIAATAPSLNASAQSLAKADSAYAAGQWLGAESLYRRVVAEDSASARGWYRLALVAQANHHPAMAVTAMRRAIVLRVVDPLAWYRVARMESVAGRTDSAAAILRRIVPRHGAPSGAAMLRVPELAWLRAPAYRALVAAADSVAYPCEHSPEARQFDFWIGQWDVTPAGSVAPPPSAGHGHNDVHPILGHCIISENWTSATGSEGKSTNWYDTNLGKWRQAWMGEGGGALDYTGEYRDGAMRFEGWTLNADGSHLLQKLTFFNVAPDTVRQLFEQSADSGKTWTPTFDGRYVRMKHRR